MPPEVLWRGRHGSCLAPTLGDRAMSLDGITDRWEAFTRAFRDASAFPGSIAAWGRRTSPPAKSE